MDFKRDIPDMDFVACVVLILLVFLFLILVMSIAYVMMVTGVLSSEFVNAVGMR